MTKAPRDLSAMIQRQPAYQAPELDAPVVRGKPGPKPKPPRKDARKVSVELDVDTYMALRTKAGQERRTHQDIIEQALKEFLSK